MPTRIHFFTPDDNRPPRRPRTRTHRSCDYSRREIAYIRRHFETKTNAEIGQVLGRSAVSVATLASKRLKLLRTVDSPALRRVRSEAQQRKPLSWTAAEKQFLRVHYQTMTSPELANRLHRTVGGVKCMARQLGLFKTPEAISRLTKRANSGQFKKGMLPHNTILGDELVVRIRRNKQRPPYKHVRVGLRQWKLYHIYLWEQAHGPVPPGHRVVFKNKDQMDCRLDNLELITCKQHVIRNSGSLNLTDGYVATVMAGRRPDLKQELLKHPELLDLQRTTYQLKRILNHVDTKPAETR